MDIESVKKQLQEAFDRAKQERGGEMKPKEYLEQLELNVKMHRFNSNFEEAIAEAYRLEGAKFMYELMVKKYKTYMSKPEVRTKRREKQKEYYQEHKDYYKEYRKKYYEQNKDKFREYAAREKGKL